MNKMKIRYKGDKKIIVKGQTVEKGDAFDIQDRELKNYVNREDYEIVKRFKQKKDKGE